jgi:HPr kinase/phosphorylase
VPDVIKGDVAQGGVISDAVSFQVHGTTIAIGAVDEPQSWVAVLIRGRPGSGKSDLALRCLSVPHSPLLPYTVRLVADDRTDITAGNDRAHASAPAAIRGLLEVRGVGILAVPHAALARLVLVVDLVDAHAVPRFPETGCTLLAGSVPPLPATMAASVVRLPHLLLAPFEASAPLKLLLALARTAQTGSPFGADAAKPHCLPEGL